MTEKTSQRGRTGSSQASRAIHDSHASHASRASHEAQSTGMTHNISLTNPHKVPRRHHEKDQVPSLGQPKHANQGNSSHTAPHKKVSPRVADKKTERQKSSLRNLSLNPRSQKSSSNRFSTKTLLTPTSRSRGASFLSSTLRSSRRLQVALTCLISAVVLLGVLGIVHACSNSSQTAPNVQEPTTNGSTSQNVMTNKLHGIAQEIGTISQTVNAIQSHGYHVGFSTQSLQGGATLGVDENRLFYSASSIKGPYILAALENRGTIPSSQRDNIEAAIVDSDNDAYFRLIQSFGIEPINAELASVGATDRLNSNDYFVHITPRQLCGLWKISASYIDSQNNDTAWLQTLFAQTLNSEIAKITGATTWSKAGWIVDEDEAYNATVDAGVVSREHLTYAMAIMCDKGEDFDAIAPLVKSLDALEQYFSQ